MTTLYKKVGRRYRPVAEYEEWDSYPAGAHLVVCSPGSTLRRFSIDPDRAGLLAAAEPLRAEIRTLVMELHRVKYASVGEIADAVVDLILKGKGK